MSASGSSRRTTRYLIKLVHEVCLIVQTAGGVDNNDIRSARFFAAHSPSYTTAAGSLPSSWRTISAPERSAQTPSCSGCCRAEGVACAKEHILAPSAFRLAASLPMVVVLPTPFTRPEDNRRHCQASSFVSILPKACPACIRQTLPLRLCPLVYIAAQQNTLIIHHYLRRGLAADIGHYQHFLKLVVEILTVDIVIAEYLFKILNIFSGLCKTTENTLSKKPIVCLPQSFFDRALRLVRSSSMTF